MQDSTDIRTKVNQMLLRHYSGLNPNFKTEQCNYKMLDSFYNVIGDAELKDLFNEIEPYIQGHSAELKSIINVNTNSFIFNQPAYLFVYFSLWHWNNKIVNGWPYDYESLISVIKWSGYSINILYNS